MSLYKEIYKRDFDCEEYDYQPIIEYFGKILIQVDDNGYQGDTRAIIQKDNKFGYLNFGWGSCSGCDALQACCSAKDVENLVLELQSDIKWFNSKKELKIYFKEKDWEGDYSWSKEQKEFIEKVLEF